MARFQVTTTTTTTTVAAAAAVCFSVGVRERVSESNQRIASCLRKDLRRMIIPGRFSPLFPPPKKIAGRFRKRRWISLFLFFFHNAKEDTPTRINSDRSSVLFYVTERYLYECN